MRYFLAWWPSAWLRLLRHHTGDNGAARLEGVAQGARKALSAGWFATAAGPKMAKIERAGNIEYRRAILSTAGSHIEIRPYLRKRRLTSLENGLFFFCSEMGR